MGARATSDAARAAASRGIQVGDHIVIVHGRLRGHRGDVLHVNATAIGFRDLSSAGAPLHWIASERLARGHVDIAVSLTSASA